MNFRYFLESDTDIYTPKKFDTLSDAKEFVFEHITSYKDIHLMMIAFIVKDGDHYIIYYGIRRSSLFIDNAIDYVQQWQEDTNNYVECILLPYYANILTIELSY